MGIVGVCFLQAKQLVSRAVSQNICQYRSLQYSRPEGPDGSLPEDLLFGANWALRPPGDGGGWAEKPHVESALRGHTDRSSPRAPSLPLQCSPTPTRQVAGSTHLPTEALLAGALSSKEPEPCPA